MGTRFRDLSVHGGHELGRVSNVVEILVIELTYHRDEQGIRIHRLGVGCKRTKELLLLGQRIFQESETS